MPGEVVAAGASPAPVELLGRPGVGALRDADDLLADLSLQEGGDKKQQSAEPGQAAALATAGLSSDAEVPPAAAAPAAAVELTPEQEAAVAECTEQFVELYEQAFLSRALQLLDQTCERLGIPEASMQGSLLRRGVDLPRLRERASELGRGIAECQSDEGWQLVSDNGKLRLLYRHTPGSTVHSFKGSCLLPAPMEQPLAMAREFDLVTSWNSYIKNSTLLRTFCDVDVLVYAAVWMPWPFSERDLIMYAVADDQLDECGVVAVSIASPSTPPPGVELPEGADKRVHVFLTPGSCMTLTPVAPPDDPAVTLERTSRGGGVAGGGVGGQRTRVAVVANIDTRIAHMPEALIHFVLRVFAPFMYSTVVKVLHKNFDDPAEPLPRRMALHHELYDMLRQRCTDYLAHIAGRLAAAVAG